MPVVWISEAAQWEYEDPPGSGRWKAVPPEHQKLCTQAMQGGSHEVSAHDENYPNDEWEYNFVDETAKLYRGRCPSFEWSLRRIQPLQLKDYHCISGPKVAIGRFRYARWCVNAGRAMRRKVLRLDPPALTTAIARKCPRARQLDA